MPSLKNVFFSSSSSSSPSDSPLSSEASVDSRRKLTRQRKLRHVTEFDLGLQPIDERSKSLPVSPNSGSLSPPNFRHWAMSAVPHPLPLPESFYQPSNVLPLQSNGRGTAGEGSSTSFATRGKSPSHMTSKSSKVPTYHRRGFRQEYGGDAQSFRLDVPARSAPTSGYTSPAVSPQRFGSIDILHSSYAVPRELKHFIDGNVASTSHVLPERITPSPDNSPIYSPALLSPHHNTKNHSSVARNSHFKSLPGSPAAWPESSSSSVHPLPLPPGAPVPSHSSNIPHTTNVSSIKGQWQKEKLIGRGTYGSVYVAISRNDGAMCAMKEVDVISSDSKSAECIKQLQQEIKVLQQLDHPNIVQYLGSEVIDDRFCIYLEYVHPGSINNYVHEHFGSITESVVRSFTRHILSGLAYLHSKNTIHRDIKGANLLVNASGVVKLADFGLAKHVLQSMMRKESTPALALAVDIWSVGCTVIEMLTGKPPWSEYSGVQAMFNVLNRSPAIPETLSAEGKDFLTQCFQRDPAKRPTAVMLLDHPFIRNLQDQNFSNCRQALSGLKMHDKSPSPVDWNRQNLKPYPLSTWIKGKAPSNGITRAKSYPEDPDLQAAKILPSPSTSDSHIASSSISRSWYNARAGKFHTHHDIKSHGREVPYP